MTKAFVLPAILAAALAGSTSFAEEADLPETQATSVSLMGPGLRVADLETATRFYRDGLGLNLLTRIPLGDAEEVIFGFGAGSEPPMLFLVGPKQGAAAPDDPPQNWRGRIVFAVPDIEALHHHLAAAGYEPGDIRRHEASGTRLFMVDDPDGHRVEIIQPSPQGEMEEIEEEAAHG
jgi:catechol 2,3-dioxygenase-like lactoylglutathione lyase family enzyme